MLKFKGSKNSTCSICENVLNIEPILFLKSAANGPQPLILNNNSF